jgi:hypothetical protein
MTARPLTPALALAYLHELSTDVRAAALLDAGGQCLAGDPSLAARADALLVERSPSGAAIVVEAGPHALLPLLRHDMRTVLGDLAGPSRAPLP